MESLGKKRVIISVRGKKNEREEESGEKEKYIFLLKRNVNPTI